MDHYKTDNISIQGYSHKRIDKECQDSSLSWQAKKYDGIIVCDGHGGEKYIRSATGSRIACEVGKDILDQFMSAVQEKKIALTEHTFESHFTQLERAILQEWRKRIEENYTELPVVDDQRFADLTEQDKKVLLHNPVKAYGTTFLAAIMSEDLCFVLKLGDGNASILYSNGTIDMPDELADDQLQFNVTTSMCNSDADVQFHHYFCRYPANKKIAGIMLTSDGIINCYRLEESFKSLVKNIFLSYFEQKKKDAGDELKEMLGTLSERGSGDDLSVALICDKRVFRGK